MNAFGPNLIAPALAQLSAEIAGLTGELGQRVDVAALGATDRRGQLKLHTPGRFSAEPRLRALPRRATAGSPSTSPARRTAS